MKEFLKKADGFKKLKMTLLTLDDICKEFEFVLLDSSAIINYLELNSLERKEASKLINKINRKKAEEASYVFFNKYIKRTKNLFVTDLILEELKYENNNSIREVLSKYDWLKIRKKEEIYFKEIRSAEKMKKNLVKSFQDKKIINFDSNENIEYSRYFKRNFYLKGKYTLSDADYDLLITGAVLSALRGKTAVLSNDFPLLYSYKSLISKEKLSTEKYGFFIRQKKEFFQRAYNNSQINLNY